MTTIAEIEAPHREPRPRGGRFDQTTIVEAGHDCASDLGDRGDDTPNAITRIRRRPLTSVALRLPGSKAGVNSGSAFRMIEGARRPLGGVWSESGAPVT
jgi:hypothetical protein